MSRRSEQYGLALIVGAAVLVAVGCKTVPSSWRTGPERVSRTACGSWAHVELEDDRAVQGEVLAVASTLLYLHDGKQLYAIPRSEVDHTMAIYADSWDGTIGIWTGIGVVSTGTHGFGLILTAPVWVVAGSISAAAERSTGRNRTTIPARKRARFPQGLPDSYASVADELDPNQVDSVEAPELAGGCPPT